MICGLPKRGAFDTLTCGAKGGVCIHRNEPDIICSLKPAAPRKKVKA